VHGLDGLFAGARKAITGNDERAYFSKLMDGYTGDAATSDMLNAAISAAATAGTAALGKALGAVDDLGRCASTLTKMVFGTCFTGDTLVHVTALGDDTAPTGSHAPGSDPADGSFITAGGNWQPVPDGTAGSSLATLPATRTLAIRDVPLGCRVLAGNPRPEEFDNTWPEPEQATWVTLGLALVKADGTPVKAEFLRPREWVERLGLSVGGLLPVGVSELDIDCEAIVTSITPCPKIAQGEGRVVTGRFVTRDAGNLVTVALENGTEIRATDVHPVWSVDREEWVPAGELEPGELVDTLASPVAVHAVDRLESALDVYNIEVHGEHVFRVTAEGVLVHNAGPAFHHYAVRAWGSTVPYGPKLLSYLDDIQHTSIHRAWSDFLKAKTGHYFNSLSGADWQQLLPYRDRRALLIEFHKNYDSGKHWSAFIDEVIKARKAGFNPWGT